MSSPDSTASTYTVPTFDLFNDFESLIATMCSLDVAILPSNSLMDFAASVGLRTYVFSPSGMMKSWAYPGTDRYIFSKQVQFFCGNADTGKEELVKSMATAISRQLSATG